MAMACNIVLNRAKFHVDRWMMSTLRDNKLQIWPFLKKFWGSHTHLHSLIRVKFGYEVNVWSAAHPLHLILIGASRHL